MPNLSTLTKAVSAPGNAPIFGCRAWVNFDGTRNASGVSDTANTPRFIRAAGNVSSVVRINQGDYTVNFTVSMPNTNYCSIIPTTDNGTQRCAGSFVATSRTLSSARINIVQGVTNTLVDVSDINCAFFC